MPVPKTSAKTEVVVWVDCRFKEIDQSVLPFVEASQRNVEDLSGSATPYLTTTVVTAELKLPISQQGGALRRYKAECAGDRLPLYSGHQGLCLAGARMTERTSAAHI